MQIFLSHSSADAGVAEQICGQLEKNGIKCFIAPRDIRPGKEYAEELINGIDESSALVLLMSQDANNSPHVLREVEHAVSSNTPILVYKIEDVVLTKSMEYFLMTHQWVNSKPNEDYADILAFAKDLEARENAGEYPSGTITKTRGSRETAGRKRKKKILKIVAIVGIALNLLSLGITIYRVRNYEAEKSANSDSVQVGDTVLFGSYLGEDIAWRVLRISNDRSQAVLISSDILTMKAYDAAESGRYNYDNGKDYWAEKSKADTDMALQIRVRGNSDWSTSNLRTWLNSDTEVVSYADQPPLSAAMAEKKNGYQNEAGFLHGFSQEERSAIVETPLTTKGNALSKTNTVTTNDKVWLLSADELTWFDEAGISKLASPTQTAIKQDESGWYTLDYQTYGVKQLSWWLREPETKNACQCYLVDNGYTQNVTRLENAGLEGFGVRPALTVDLHTAAFRGGK